MAKKITNLDIAPPGNAEADEFRAAMRGVKPLAYTSPVPKPAKNKPRPKPGTRRSSERVAQSDLDALMPLIATTDMGEAASRDDAVAGSAVLSFQRGGVRLPVMRRLKRGLIPIDDELDLHGLTQAAAREGLAHFITRSRDSGHRCVRVIHGKGYRSGARGPVLKTAVNLWLRRHTDVIAFASARAIDGGTGAVYVLLRG